MRNPKKTTKTAKKTRKRHPKSDKAFWDVDETSMDFYGDPTLQE